MQKQPLNKEQRDKRDKEQREELVAAWKDLRQALLELGVVIRQKWRDSREG